MALKKGKCTNYDGCTKADRDEIIEVDEFDDFVCPECGKPLEALESRKKKKKNDKDKNKMLFIIGGSVVALGIIGAIVFALIGSKEKEEIKPFETETAPADSVDVKKDEVTNRNDTLVIKIEGQQEGEEAEAVQEVPAVKETPVAKPVAPAKPAATTPAQPSTHKLGYGTWTGGMKNGQPHGTGTLTYSTSRTIDERDSKGRVAQPGEYVVGEWDNGHLVQGRWFKNDGSKEAIICL